MKPYITLDQVSYRYPLTTELALKNISLTVEKGEILGIIGVNGSGKTTLCNIIRSFIPNFYQGTLSGSVTVDGRALETYSETELSTLIGYIFQNPFTQISGVKDTVKEEIGYGLENLGQAAEVIQARVNEVITLLNLQKIEDKNPFDLSGGQKQLVAIAAILAIDPAIYIFDEPTSQLDPVGTRQVFEIIKQLKAKHKTVIIVEHKVDLMAQLIDRVVVLNQDGQQVAFDEPGRVFAQLDEQYTAGLPTATQIYKQLKVKYQLPETDTVPIKTEEIVAIINQLKK